MAGLMAGFDDKYIATPTATPAEHVEVNQASTDSTPEVDERPPEDAAPEYVQLTKVERDELFSLRQQAEKQFGTAFGKIGGIERRLQELNSGAQVEIKQEDIDALKEDFPPLAAALEKVRNMRSMPSGLDAEKMDALLTERVTAVERKFELRLLSQAHPDWQQIDVSPEFKAWVSAQPDEFKQKLVEASNAYDSSVVGEVMSKFKQSRKSAPEKTAADDASAQRSRMRAAVTPRGVGGPAAPKPTDDLMAGFNE